MTIKDIARESGYAISTVSRALNNHPDVSKKAKEQIEKLVKEYGFEPNKNARQLKAQHSKGICILVKGSFNMFFAAILERMQANICDAGYTAEVHYADEDCNEIAIAKQLLRETKPMGIIFLGANQKYFEDEFSAIKIPCVVAASFFSGYQNEYLSTVGVDDTRSAKKAVDFLFENGHKKIAVIGSNPKYSNISQKRLEGAILSYTQQGLTFDEGYFGTANYSYHSSYKAMQQLLTTRPDITAVFAMSDVMAIGAIRAISEKGKNVPKDISVIGFDGLELAEYYLPKLATVKQPQAEIANLAVELLLEKIENHKPCRNLQVEATLIGGESVSPI